MEKYSFEKAEDESVRIQEKAMELSKNANPSGSDYWLANDLVDEENRLSQGAKASEIFRGEINLKPMRELYGETAQTFADVIKENLPELKRSYRIADFGCFKGELLESVVELLKEHDLYTVGIDLEKNLRESTTVKEKIPADLASIPMPDKSVDFGIARYVLHWNSPEKQVKILKEICRVIKQFAVIQHVGADSISPKSWRDKMDDLFDGEEISKLERHGHFFSSSEEVEDWMKENNIKFKRILERKVDRVSDVLAQRFSLSGDELRTVEEMLGDKDYITQTTWVVFPVE